MYNSHILLVIHLQNGPPLGPTFQRKMGTSKGHNFGWNRCGPIQKKEPEPHKWSHHYNLGLSRMTKYIYIYTHVFSNIWILLYTYIPNAPCNLPKHWFTVESEGFFSEVPLLPLLMMIFPREPGFGQPPVSPTWLSFPISWLTSGCGLRGKIKKTWLFRLGYRLSHQKKKTTTPPLGYPNVHHFNRTSCWWP